MKVSKRSALVALIALGMLATTGGLIAMAQDTGSDTVLSPLGMPPDEDEISRSEGGELGHRLEDGRLVTHILAEVDGGSVVNRSCYFDAAVTLQDGAVRTIVQAPSHDRQRNLIGLPVRDLPRGFESGRINSIAVHFGAEGAIVGGYESCVDEVFP